ASNALIFTVAGPTVNPGGTVNGASFSAGAAVSPGSIASVFGTSFTLLQGPVTVRMNGTTAPVFAVSDTQINLQVPWEMAGLAQSNLTVSAGGVTSRPVDVSLTTFAPGIFSTNSSGNGQGAILIANTASLAAPAGMFPGSQPVSRGEFISIFCTGLGPVSNQPPTGVSASDNPPSLTTTTPTVTIGGITMEADFSGLAPAFFGLYQVNVQVPSNAPTGDAVEVVLTIGGVASNTVTIAVE
ncbi:MAG: hypothetical protein O7A06_06835, partial [Acidobacteria bacterium]|nr:hypothetical protein [Acidobacteriota bacterium]